MSASVVVIPDSTLEANMKHFDTAAVMVDAAIGQGLVPEEDRPLLVASVFNVLLQFYGMKA